VVLHAAASFGFDVEQATGEATWSVGLGTESLVDRLPGIPPGEHFLGTFDREEAVRRETLDFFASGHPLVEGILTELQEGDRGRTACFEITGDREGFGLVAVYKRGPHLEAVVVDDQRRQRPELAELLVSGASQLEPVNHRLWTSLPEWADAVHRMARKMPRGEIPQAVAAFRIRAGG